MSSTSYEGRVGVPVTSRVHMRYIGGYWWLKMRDAHLTFAFRPTTPDMKHAHVTVYSR